MPVSWPSSESNCVKASNPPADAPADLEDDYDDESEWSYKELQTEAKERELPASGSREEIVARLRENDAANATA